MKRFLLILLALIFTVPVYATDYDFSGHLRYHNDVVSWNVITDATAVTVFTSSWDEGNFDPELQVWNATTGELLYQQDDGHNIGSTISNGISYSHGYWDTYYSLNLGEGTYMLTLSTYHNYAMGNNLNNPQFAYANETPILMSAWNQPANTPTGFDGLSHDNDYYEVHFLNAVNVTPLTTPEPATMVLFGLGILGLAGVSRRKNLK